MNLIISQGGSIKIICLHVEAYELFYKERLSKYFSRQRERFRFNATLSDSHFTSGQFLPPYVLNQM